jgi:SRSO17 transposase
LVSASRWSDAELHKRLALKLRKELPGVEAFVLDDTGFAKKGQLSVGVHRQYSGTLGRIENCQVATSLHIAGEGGSGCIGLRLYLPEAWTGDRARCRAAGVPEDIEFKTKWQIALELLDQALSWGLEKMPVLADAGYGEITDFRAAQQQATRSTHQATLARRARLSGDEGRARSRSLRGAYVARLPPSRNAVRRRPWIPRAPKGAFPPEPSAVDVAHGQASLAADSASAHRHLSVVCAAG